MGDTVEVAERVEAAPPGRPSRSILRRVGDEFLRRREASVLIVAVGLGVYFASAHPAFLTQPNLVNISRATAPTAIVAAGMVLALLMGIAGGLLPAFRAARMPITAALREA